ncbi:outer membrane lipoprotein carrier protein LolA [Sphingomonas naphthae]|uniref:Outer membrane lipoprotein carrier protein LolA n=1 Tax=Sphingomonas naphthae TaxID=1813468 RepID=A0ABY7TJH4_9SPHN|nr:outer membrane lipoprotein carrier protein LolA [Sphingomonas naphthae]WCT73183.1 outer membrane lipoprotein carrier protein LolA [Sphingomonas naphthae]
MSPRFLALPLVAIAAIAAPVAAQRQATLAEVQAHLKAVSTMTATFVQTDRNGKALGGVLTLKRPGRVRFQYEKGVPLLIVGDGKALTMIDYSVRQVSRWPIGSSPLSILTNPDKDIAAYARIVESPDPNLVLIEGKDRKHPEFGTITMAFARVPGAPGGLRMEGWSTLDAQGNRSSVRLSNQRFGVAVSDETFRWRDPRPVGRNG